MLQWLDLHPGSETNNIVLVVMFEQLVAVHMFNYCETNTGGNDDARALYMIYFQFICGSEE
jgi:hypothetical protein